MTTLRAATFALVSLSLLTVGCSGGGGGGADAPAPYVLSRSPTAGETDSTAASIHVVFSETMDAASLSTGFTVARTGGGAIDGVVVVAGDEAEFTPTLPFPAAASITVTLSPDVRSARGGRLGIAQDWAFASAHWRALSAIGAPTARSGHTAVWTGTEMIVWGGAPTTLAGGRYDPATDTWRSTAVAGAPAGRTGHTAVWTGSEMIVWGGTVGAYPVATGGRYDPATDTWRSVSTTGAPSARSGHTAVWTGTVMIVWGGSMGLGGARYDPALDSWTPMTATGQPYLTSEHGAVWGGGRMAVWGGYQSTNYCMICLTNEGGLYDPVADSWTAMTTVGAPSARKGHSMASTGTEVLVTGGAAGGGGRYDPGTDTWLPIADAGAPSTRVLPHAVWTGTNLLVWSGTTGTGVPIRDGGFWDPATDGWSPASAVGGPASRRLDSASVWTGTELLVWGGSAAPGARFTP